MSKSTASQSEGFQPWKASPPIRQLLDCLYSRVTSHDYTHDANPWSDSDPGLQSISTASLELLQDHADFHMQAFLHIHELLDREIVDRKLAARTQLVRPPSLRTLPGGSSVSEVLFDVEDLEPLSGFLGARDCSIDFQAAMPGEKIEAMARMAYSWVDGDRSNAVRQRRTDTRPTAVRSQSSLNTVVEARTEAGSDEQSDRKDQSIADVVELEIEMDYLDQAGDAELFSEVGGTNGR